jgi:hypothetical protein
MISFKNGGFGDNSGFGVAHPQRGAVGVSLRHGYLVKWFDHCNREHVMVQSREEGFPTTQASQAAKIMLYCGPREQFRVSPQVRQRSNVASRRDRTLHVSGHFGPQTR